MLPGRLWPRICFKAAVHYVDFHLRQQLERSGSELKLCRFVQKVFSSTVINPERR